MDTNDIQFYNNRGSLGGALYFAYSTMNISTNKTVKFIMNTAQLQGGAIHTSSGVHPAIIVGNYSNLLLLNNSACQGGALFTMLSSFMITAGYQSSIQFINNTALEVGGAVYSLSSIPCILFIENQWWVGITRAEAPV